MQIDPRTIRDPRTIHALRAQGVTWSDIEPVAAQLGVPRGAARSVWDQTITNTPSNGFWCRLKGLKLDPLARNPLELDHHSSTFTCSAEDLYTAEYIDDLQARLDIWISHVQVFHKWGNEDSSTLHTDTSAWGSCAAINYVVGEDTGVMRWYDERNCTPTGVRDTSANDRSQEYTTQHLPTHELDGIGATPTLVRTDVPHTVETQQERVCISWRLHNRSTWQSHVDLLAPLL